MQGSACPHLICDGSGTVYDEETNTGSACQCRLERIVARRVAKALSPVPKRYRDVALERNPIISLPAGVRMELQRYLDNIAGHVDAGEGLWLEGPMRIGKTSAAALITKTAAAAGKTVAFQPVVNLLMMIRHSFRDESTISELELHQQLADVDLLVLDDLAAARPTPWVTETLYAIVNSRLNEQRAIVVTSDKPATELAELFDKRTVNRLLEICGRPIVIDVPHLKAVGE